MTSAGWYNCRFLTCSVLPVRIACNLSCPFCFSRSSISALQFETADPGELDVEAFYEYSKDRGATRLVITGGGEPLLKPDFVVSLVDRGRQYFDEIACFTNGTNLTHQLADRLRDAGLSYLCYSRHHFDDEQCRHLMGPSAPRLDDFMAAADGLCVRATCVMTEGGIDSVERVDQYMNRLTEFGITQFTFKHTYVAYKHSLFGSSAANSWSREHQVEFDPFAGRGTEIARLPWGPVIRRLQNCQVCYYFEPTPQWELENQLCRSSNLLSDGSVYASLEDQRSQLFQLKHSLAR